MDRLEQKLGFDKVRRGVADRCETAYAADRAGSEEFCTDPAEILERLASTDEMRLIVMFEDAFPVTGYVDSLPFLIPLSNPGYNIDVINLARLSTVLETERRAVAFFAGIRDGVYPRLKKMSSGIRIFPEIRTRIDGILDRHGAIRDTASPELAEIRRRLKAAEASISRIAGTILSHARAEGICDPEAQVSVRDGKYLIPVITSSKRKLPGFVYDCSASGKTTFVEPAEIVETENEIIGLRSDEAREIARILQEFSEFVRPYVPDLIAGAEIMGEFDFLIAKARTALDMVAGMPVISTEGRFDLRKARHPLLESALRRDGRQICPLTVTLDAHKRILLISGPNAGGKSVCLKTAGLLQYMMQWGLLVPTSESSELPVFDRIIVSIGDDQSIENDLSTYSSFLADMREMLSEADDRTLVLIDEFGSGTDPAAGGAIAEAILAELDRRGAYGVITTHYTNLKLYASGQDTHVVNGAMLYDTARIAPMFKLEIGLPGNSFAFELARKMGLPDEVVRDAESRAGRDYVGMEENLQKIARGRKALDDKLKEVKDAGRALEGMTEKYQTQLDEIQQKRREILDEAREEAEAIVKGAGSRVEKTIRDIRESQADRQKTRDARAELQGFIRAIETRKAAVEKKVSLEPLRIGEKVRVKSNGMVGEVVGVGGKGSVSVITGSITARMSEDKLERISANEYRDAVRRERPATYRADPAVTSRRLEFKTELDLRGERLQDALDDVMHYIDDALMVDIGSVRIIHGKGTGVLREEIQKYLRTVPGVACVADEDVRRGGAGVTVVTFG